MYHVPAGPTTAEHRRKRLVSLREEIRLLSVADIREPLSEEEMEKLALHNPDIRLSEGEILFQSRRTR
jgi:hypothetical protein